MGNRPACRGQFGSLIVEQTKQACDFEGMRSVDEGRKDRTKPDKGAGVTRSGKGFQPFLDVRDRHSPDGELPGEGNRHVAVPPGFHITMAFVAVGQDGFLVDEVGNLRLSSQARCGTAVPHLLTITGTRRFRR